MNGFADIVLLMLLIYGKLTASHEETLITFLKGLV